MFPPQTGEGKRELRAAGCQVECGEDPGLSFPGRAASGGVVEGAVGALFILAAASAQLSPPIRDLGTEG